MSLIQAFMNEFGQIENEKIRDFTVEALAKVPDFYDRQTSYINETRKAIEFAEVFLETLQSSEYVSDVVKSAILLQDITRFKAKYDEEGDASLVENLMHPLDVRIELSSLKGIVGEDAFDDIMRTIESSHGLNSPIPHVMPKIDSPVHIWILPFVNQLARAYSNN